MLLVEWLNCLVYEMATRKMLFCRFEVKIENHKLQALVWGEEIDVRRHKPCTEVKAATVSDLKVRQREDGMWVAQCIVDV